MNYKSIRLYNNKIFSRRQYFHKKEDIENTGSNTYKCQTPKGSITIKFKDNSSANVIGTEKIDGKDTQVLQGVLKRK